VQSRGKPRAPLDGADIDRGFPNFNARLLRFIISIRHAVIEDARIVVLRLPLLVDDHDHQHDLRIQSHRFF